jgi:hypothetical protein
MVILIYMFSGTVCAQGASTFPQVLYQRRLLNSISSSSSSSSLLHDKKSDLHPKQLDFSSIMDPTPSSSALLRLPVEIHLEIAELVAHTDTSLCTLALRITNRYFNAIIPTPSHGTLLSLERSSPFLLQHDLYTCGYCLRLRPASKFAVPMMRGRKRRNPGSRKKSAARLCLDCGFALFTRQWDVPVRHGHMYTPGADVIVNNENGTERWVWCRVCKVLKKGPLDKERRSRCNCNGRCRECCSGFMCREGREDRAEEERRRRKEVER